MRNLRTLETFLSRVLKTNGCQKTGTSSFGKALDLSHFHLQVGMCTISFGLDDNGQKCGSDLRIGNFKAGGHFIGCQGYFIDRAKGHYCMVIPNDLGARIEDISMLLDQYNTALNALPERKLTTTVAAFFRALVTGGTVENEDDSCTFVSSTTCRLTSCPNHDEKVPLEKITCFNSNTKVGVVMQIFRPNDLNKCPYVLVISHGKHIGPPPPPSHTPSYIRHQLENALQDGTRRISVLRLLSGMLAYFQFIIDLTMS